MFLQSSLAYFRTMRQHLVMIGRKQILIDTILLSPIFSDIQTHKPLTVMMNHHEPSSAIINYEQIHWQLDIITDYSNFPKIETINNYDYFNRDLLCLSVRRFELSHTTIQFVYQYTSIYVHISPFATCGRYPYIYILIINHYSYLFITIVNKYSINNHPYQSSIRSS